MSTSREIRREHKICIQFNLQSSMTAADSPKRKCNLPPSYLICKLKRVSIIIQNVKI